MSELFNFSKFPLLETRRLLLRELHPMDAEAIFDIRGDALVTRYNGGMPYESLHQAARLINEIQQDYRDQRALRWGITLKEDGDRVIGMCGFNYWIRRDYRASIGYDLARAYWGRGIMTEAVRGVIRFGFEYMGLNRIEADADIHNLASHRVLEKAGFQREGIQREQFFERGMFGDLLLFSLLRRDYEQLYRPLR